MTKTNPALSRIASKAEELAERPPETGRRRASAAPKAETRMIGGHFAPEYARELRLIAAGEDRSLQSLLQEAIDDFLLKKGRTIAN